MRKKEGEKERKREREGESGGEKLKNSLFFSFSLFSVLKNIHSFQADKGSAGVEMNQCNAEISFNKFAYGKSEKGGGLYLQGVGEFFWSFLIKRESQELKRSKNSLPLPRPSLPLLLLRPKKNKFTDSVGDIKGCVFESNAASFGGGVFRGSSTGNLVDSTFKGNRAKSFGGGLYDSHVSGDVAGCKFTGNRAARGAALFRTESKGDSGDNKGVDEETAVVDNPAV